MLKSSLIFIGCLWAFGACTNQADGTDTGPDSEGYTDTDSDSDSDVDTDADSDTDTDVDSDTCTGAACPSPRDTDSDSDPGTDRDTDSATTNEGGPQFKVIAFYTGVNDVAHVSYVNECNQWFPTIAEQYNFIYDSTDNWDNMNADFLSEYQVVLFLDTRPEEPAARDAFREYMENGGGWMGFHFSAFALAGSVYDNNWDWYHNEFLGSGEYQGNTWAPTEAVLKVESTDHPSMANLPSTWVASPNEWYSWQVDLRTKDNIEIICSIDESSFPLGTGPKEWEIWWEGYYPVVWSNTDYRMMYVNMGHNDMDYSTNTAKQNTYDNDQQAKFIIDSLFWLAKKLS